MSVCLPLVSIIVPIYNVEKYLNKCLDSILAQTYKNIEIILVDDGSTDDSGKIADAYANNNKNIIVIHQKNGGLSSARNRGLEKAKGEWVCFVDSDDYVDKEFIGRMYRMVDTDIEIVTCGVKTYSDDGSILKKEPVWPFNELSGKEALNDMMKNRRPAYIWLSMFKLRLFKDNKILFPQGRNYEDIATRVKLLYFAKKVAYTNEKMYHYLIRKGSITGGSFSKKHYDDFNYAIEDVKKFLGQADRQQNCKYLNYFEYYSMNTLLNYIAREKTLNASDKKIWDLICKKLRKKYSYVEFPSVKIKIKYRLMLLLSRSKSLYSILYGSVKK